jgi:hypothetical protein
MTQAKMSFLIGYVLLVVLQIAVLSGILKQGDKPIAPVAAGGLWKVQIHLSQPGAPTFLEAVHDGNPLLLSQPPESLLPNLGSASAAGASGVIDGATIKAAGIWIGQWPDDAGCKSVAVIGTRDQKSNLNSPAKLFSISDCSACRAVEFRVVREVQTAAKTGQ